LRVSAKPAHAGSSVDSGLITPRLYQKRPLRTIHGSVAPLGAKRYLCRDNSLCIASAGVFGADARPRTTAACRAAFRRVKVRVGALARRSSGCFTEQFGRHGSAATFAARLRELSAFGSRQASWHESPPSRCTKTPTAWASLKGGVHLFVSFRVLRRQVFVTRCNWR
jgi:hypothetical protein